MEKNMKPADELAFVREQIRDLKGREAYLKAGITSGDLPMVGDEVRAVIVSRTQGRLDRDKIRAALGQDLGAYSKQIEYQSILLENVEDD